MRVERLEFFHADLPFRFSFQHAAAARAASESLFVKLTLSDGTVGWGEALPRRYVTGESVASSLAALRNHLGPLVLGESLEKPEDVYRVAGKIAGDILPDEKDGGLTFGAARCAIEIALLDAASRAMKLRFADWMGPMAREEAYATAVIPAIASRGKLMALLALIRCAGFRAVKVKVGTSPHDEKTLGLVRSILGKEIPLLVDANGAWQAQEAVEKLRAWKRFNIRMVEQPVSARDLAGMRKVREETGLDVMADESLRNLYDAENLIDSRACTHFNIRISKCGGVLSSWKIYKLARSSGIGCQLGCQVGESSILATAGKWFALCAPDLLFYEGGYGRWLLRTDIAAPPMHFGWRGRVRENSRRLAQGLGVTVREPLLLALAKEHTSLP